MNFFTGDTHFRHTNIIRHMHRPFETVDLMDRRLIENWNRVVKPGDTVFHLGDFAFCSFVEALKIRAQLNGSICLIHGNHDRSLIKKPAFRELFVWNKDYYVLKVPDEEMGVVQRIALFHYPIEEESWDGFYHGTWHLHGHRHGSIDYMNVRGRLDVSVDTNDWTPVSYEEVKARMTRQVIQPPQR